MATLDQHKPSSALADPPRTFTVAGILVATLIALAAMSYPNAEFLFATTAQATADSAVASTIAVWITEPGLIALVLFTAGLVVYTLWPLVPLSSLWPLFGPNAPPRRALTIQLMVSGVGVILAYLTSKTIKSIAANPRPCQDIDVATVLACPAPDSFSWPSNHSVLAASFATACILVIPALGWWLAPVALVVGLSRVPVGRHYFHDVFSGLALGVIVVVLVTFVGMWVLKKFAPGQVGESPELAIDGRPPRNLENTQP